MTSVPVPVLVAFAILLGWPLLQLAGLLLARGPRKRLNRLVASALADPDLTPDERAFVLSHRDSIRAGRWDGKLPGIAALPVSLPVAAIVQAGQRLAGHPPRPRSKDDGVADPDFLRSNPRMGEIFDLSTLVAALRHPVTSLLVLLGLPITALGFSIAHGRRGLPVALRHQVALH